MAWFRLPLFSTMPSAAARYRGRRSASIFSRASRLEDSGRPPPTVSASSGIYGIIMHIIATGTFVLVAGFLYQKHKTKKGALIALLCGVVAWGLIMMPANLIITPIFTGMPVEAIRGILLPIILPFNLIKAGINAVVTFLVYKSVSPLLHR